MKIEDFSPKTKAKIAGEVEKASSFVSKMSKPDWTVGVFVGVETGSNRLHIGWHFVKKTQALFAPYEPKLGDANYPHYTSFQYVWKYAD